VTEQYSSCSLIQVQESDFPFPLNPQIINESILVHEIFKTVQVELNQAKMEDKILNETLSVLPCVFSLFDDIVGKYVRDEHNPAIKEEKIKHISKILTIYIKGIIPWSKFVKYSQEE
jgi:hypothetical protein